MRGSGVGVQGACPEQTRSVGGVPALNVLKRDQRGDRFMGRYVGGVSRPGVRPIPAPDMVGNPPQRLVGGRSTAAMPLLYRALHRRVRGHSRGPASRRSLRRRHARRSCPTSSTYSDTRVQSSMACGVKNSSHRSGRGSNTLAAVPWRAGA